MTLRNERECDERCNPFGIQLVSKIGLDLSDLLLASLASHLFFFREVLFFFIGLSVVRPSIVSPESSHEAYVIGVDLHRHLTDIISVFALVLCVF